MLHKLVYLSWDGLDFHQMKTSAYRTRSVERALGVLKAFIDAGPQLTLTQVCAATALTPSTAYRLLANLVAAGYVEPTQESNAYRLGLTVIRLAGVALGQLDVRVKAAPLMDELRNRTRETVHLAALDGRRIIYLEKLEGLHAIGLMSSRVGRTAPAHCTALGRVLLASNPQAAEEILKGPLEAPTPRTVVNPRALRALLALVNEQGYALDMGEHEPEVRCVAAPIRNHSGAAIAAMSVSGPAQRIEPMLTEGLVTEVVVVARAISGLLGYLGSDRARTVDETAAT
ncbi:MAG TPA: IclR family transcriptional regulator [Chloroflexi bacterium]|jgi:DNA-binding IclR family transcriptional regulator|nr:IclR family transcriptional regulator [Chloroflexota bacterium]